MCKYVKKECFEHGLSYLLGAGLLQWAKVTPQGRYVLLQDWIPAAVGTHWWPEAQLSHFLKRHFWNSSRILPQARQHAPSCILSSSSLPQASFAASSHPTAPELFAHFARHASVELRCLIPLHTLLTFMAISNFRGGIAPNTLLNTMEWGALNSQSRCDLYQLSKYMAGDSKESLQKCWSSAGQKTHGHISSCPAGLKLLPFFY